MIKEEHVYQYFIANATHIMKFDSFSHCKYELNKHLNCCGSAENDTADPDTIQITSHDVYLIRLADDIAHEAHKGQKDRGRHEYILHPVSVSNLIQSNDTDHVTEQSTALLHDKVEDTGITLDDLGKIFNRKVIDALASVTHRKTETYEEYMNRLEKNPIARTVKRAELTKIQTCPEFRNHQKKITSGLRNIWTRSFVYSMPEDLNTLPVRQWLKT